MTGPYTFTSEMRVKPEHLEEFCAALEATVDLVRREPACLVVRAHQSPDDPTVFMMYEQWADRAAFVDEVMARDYYVAYKAATESFHREPRIVRVWSPRFPEDPEAD